MKLKKLLAGSLAAVMTVGLLAGCGGSSSSSSSSEQKEETAAASSAEAASTEEAPAEEAPAEEATAESKGTINLWSFTDEIPKMVDKFLEMNPDFGYDVETTIIATTNGEYQPALDAALTAGGQDAPDMYAAEAAFILKYSQGDMAEYAAAYDDLGIDTAAEIEAADIASYSVEIGTRPSDGKVVALGYQATGGAFIYRRSIANDVFGTDDPDAIGEIIGAGTGNFDKFFEAAAKLKEKGYAVVSGDGDLWHPVENSSDDGWIVDGALTLDPKREAFLEYSKLLKDNGYSNDSTDWTESWFADMTKSGTAFGFFGPAWLINYTLGQNCGEGDESSYGDWAVAVSPVGFFWGGTWVLANTNSDKKEAVGQIIDWITLNCTEDGLQYMWANGTLNGEGGTKDTVASGTVMAMSNGELEFLGGQNMFDIFVPANAYANGKNLTPYDEKINSLWRDQVREYSAGNKSAEDAIAAWKQNVSSELGIE